MTACSVEPCNKPVDRRGMCSVHYIRNWNYGDPRAYRVHQNGGEPAAQRPTIRDLEWAAGFYEGEGSCSCGNRPGDGFQVTMHQNNVEPLKRFYSIFGGREPYVSRAALGNRQSQHRWYASGSRARGIVLTLYPLLSARRQAQIRVALGK